MRFRIQIFLYLSILFFTPLYAQEHLYTPLIQTIDRAILNVSENDNISQAEINKLIKDIDKGYKAVLNNQIKNEELKNNFTYYKVWQLKYLEGNYEAVMPLLKDLYKVFSNDTNLKTKLPFLYSNICKDLADIEKDLNLNYKAAERYYLQALEAISKDKVLDYSTIMIRLAVVYLEINNAEKAIQFAQEAAQIRKEALGIKSIHYIGALNILASTYEGFDEFKKAEDIYRDAIDLFVKYQSSIVSHKYIELINNLGVLYLNRDNLEQAEPLLLEVMNYDKKHNGINSESYAFSCHNLALLYTKKEKYNVAKLYYETSLKIAEKNEDQENYAKNLYSVGDFFKKIQDYDNALKHYEKSINIYNSLLEKTTIVAVGHLDALNRLQQLYKDLKDYNKALEYININLALQEKSANKSKSYYLQSLIDLAEVYYFLNDFKNAYKYLFATLKGNSIENLILHDYEALAKGKWSYPDLAIKQIMLYANIKKAEIINQPTNKKQLLEDNYTLLKIAFNLSKQHKNDLAGDKDKAALLKNLYNITQAAFDAGYQLYGNNFIADAFTLIENNKGVLLSDAIKAQSAKNLLPKDLINKESALSSQYFILQRALKEINKPEEENRLRRELVEVKQEFESFKFQLQKDYPKYYEAKYSESIATLKNIQEVLEPQELMIQYFVRDSSLCYVALTSKSAKLYSMPITAIMLSDSVKLMQKLLSDFDYLNHQPKQAYEQYISSALWFYESLLKQPFTDFPNQKMVIIIPDAELGVLPFEAFLTEQAPQNSIIYEQLPYVIKVHNIVYHYSASLWLNQRLNPKTEGIKYGKVLGMAGSYSDEFVVPESRSFSTKHTRNLLTPLNSVLLELEAVREKYNGNFHTGKYANEELFKSKASDYDIIHLAMHGLGNQINPAYSALFFTENGQGGQDNVLEAWEIMQLSLNARLVVLSACESGIGTFLRGEGVSSLARAFMYSGASSLLVSLWKVNDQATAALMKNYYQGLSEVKHKSIALQNAKLEFLETYRGAVAHPAYWAAFIQIGDNSPIAPIPHYALMYALIGGTIFLLIGGYGFYKYLTIKQKIARKNKAKEIEA